MIITAYEPECFQDTPGLILQRHGRVPQRLLFLSLTNPLSSFHWFSPGRNSSVHVQNIFMVPLFNTCRGKVSHIRCRIKMYLDKASLSSPDTGEKSTWEMRTLKTYSVSLCSQPARPSPVPFHLETKWLKKQQQSEQSSTAVEWIIQELPGEGL